LETAADFAETAAANFAVHAGWAHARSPGMRQIDRGDLLLADSGLVSDTFNVICRARLGPADASARARESVEYFRAAGRRFSWWVFPSDRPQNLRDALRAAGLRHAETETGMRADLSGPPSDQPGSRELAIARVTTPAQLEAFARVSAAGAAPPDRDVIRFYELAASALLSRDCPLRLYAGSLGGETVCTAELAVGARAAGVYGVATLASHRRRGFASTLLARILHDARGEGLAEAFLQAAPGAASLYRRLGFRAFGEVEEYKDARSP
jgi:ribosomal protein S18 acetylase RimI-like enzyme